GGTVQQGGDQYLGFIFPGVVALSLLFTATFSAISIVFDREVGFLKAVLVAPVSRRSIALGKVVSGAVIALAQACLLLIAAPFAGVSFGLLNLAGFLVFMLLSGIVFSALGVAVAANFSSTEVFPVVLNALLLPMFFISGALFPLDSAPGWLQAVAYADPVAYGVDLLRGSVLGEFHFPIALSLTVLFAAILVLTWLAVIVFERGEAT
ncbi:MAG: ABC transporter permease, partial [Caldilineaceae bacterium]|nr:ABC transporter permease [Caldilineaceae bacterium]